MWRANDLLEAEPQSCCASLERPPQQLRARKPSGLATTNLSRLLPPKPPYPARLRTPIHRVLTDRRSARWAPTGFGMTFFNTPTAYGGTELCGRGGLRSFEFHEWVFLDSSMTVTLNFAENMLSVTQYAAQLRNPRMGLHGRLHDGYAQFCGKHAVCDVHTLDSHLKKTVNDF